MVFIAYLLGAQKNRDGVENKPAPRHADARNGGIYWLRVVSAAGGGQIEHL